jgi:hypothetical protein
MMSKLRFDPVTYQFYYRCRAEESDEVRAAGFGWDPIRRRYYTEDPGVALCLARRGDSYVRQLLADSIGSVALDGCCVRTKSGRTVPGAADIAFASTAIH